MHKPARSKLQASSMPVPHQSRFRSRPFVDETQTKQGVGKGPRGRHGSFLAPVRGFGDGVAHDPTSFIVQPKLSLASMGDAYEQEADRVAAHVASGFSRGVAEMAPPMLRLQRLVTSTAVTPLPPEAETGIQRARSGGSPIAPSLRAPMERATGADFSDVRVHTDTQADQLSRSLHAQAFTVGQNIFFRAGHYHPTDQAGMQILAHELAHVGQQTERGVQARVQVPTGIVGRSSIPQSNHYIDGFVQRLFFEGEHFDEKSIPLGNLQTLIIRMKIRGDRPERIRHYENILKRREEGEGIAIRDRWSEMNESTMSSNQLAYLIRKAKGRDVERLNALEEEQKRRQEQSESTKTTSNSSSNSTFQAIFGSSTAAAPSRTTLPSATPRSATVLTPPVQFSPASTVAEAARTIDLYFCFRRDYPSMPVTDQNGQPVSVTMILKGKAYMSKSDLGSSYENSGFGESYWLGAGAQWVVHVHRTHAGNLRPEDKTSGKGWCTLQHIDQEGTESGKIPLDNAKVVSLGIAQTTKAPDPDWFKSKFTSKAKTRK